MARIEDAGHEASQALAAHRRAVPELEPEHLQEMVLRCEMLQCHDVCARRARSVSSPNASSGSSRTCPGLLYKVDDRKPTFMNPYVKEALRARNLDSEEIIEAISQRGTLHGVGGVPEDLKRTFVTAHEVEFEWHVRTQAAFQKDTDNGVSKTINLPNSAVTGDIERAYGLAYELGCLGITVFRDGCKGTRF